MRALQRPGLRGRDDVPRERQRDLRRSARAGDGTSVGKTFHRIEENVLRREIETGGFKLVAEGDFWRHPEDPRDFSIQPPSGKAVDEFVLKFQKTM